MSQTVEATERSSGSQRRLRMRSLAVGCWGKSKGLYQRRIAITAQSQFNQFNGAKVLILI